jgi:hypothetical protein
MSPSYTSTLSAITIAQSLDSVAAMADEEKDTRGQCKDEVRQKC